MNSISGNIVSVSSARRTSAVGPANVTPTTNQHDSLPQDTFQPSTEEQHAADAPPGNWFQRRLNGAGNFLGWATEEALEGAGRRGGALLQGASRLPGGVLSLGGDLASVSHHLPFVDKEDSQGWAEGMRRAGDSTDAVLAPIGDAAAEVTRNYTEGLGEHMGGAVQGTLQMAAHPVATAEAVVDTAQAAWQDPVGFGRGVVQNVGEEIAQDYREGGTAKVVGSAVGVVAETVVGSKGLGKLRPGRGGHVDSQSSQTPVSLQSRSGSATPEGSVAPDIRPKRRGTNLSADNYNYRYPKGWNSQSAAYDPAALAEKLKTEYAEVERLFPEGERGKYIHASESGAIRDQAKEIIDQAVASGRISSEAGRLSIFAVRERIAKDLKSGGVRLQSDTLEDLVRSQYEVRTSRPHNPTNNIDSTRELTLAPMRQSYYAATANRALELDPELVKVQGREVKVYNANATSTTLGSAHIAVGNMARHAPRLAEPLEEIHFAKNLNTVTKREVASDGSVRNRQGGTNGEIFQENAAAVEAGLDNTASTIHISANPGNSGPGAIASLVPEATSDHVRLLSQIERTQRRMGTIYHETAHLLDQKLGKDGKLWSESSPDSPFLNTEGSSAADFVSEYARTKPVEDFAETVRVVMQLAADSERAIRRNDLGGGSLSAPLREKLQTAADLMGTDPAVLERIPGWI